MPGNSGIRKRPKRQNANGPIPFRQSVGYSAHANISERWLRSCVSEHHQWLRAVESNIAQAILGKGEVIRLALVALLAEGHLLIEDAPGVGKTSIAKAIAQSLGCKFPRLQCTPDMLPSDILGSSVFLPNKGEFEFRPGPLFTNLLLADEINRTTPRTQSALLEAMMERQI